MTVDDFPLAVAPLVDRGPPVTEGLGLSGTVHRGFIVGTGKDGGVRGQYRDFALLQRIGQALSDFTRACAARESESLEGNRFPVEM